jgi:thiol:disulfide interchange protein DsbA
MEKKMRRILSTFLFSTAMILMAACEAESDGEKYQAGKNYFVLDNPVRTNNSDKVEVVEVFQYGCGHCYQFSPVVTEWSASLPEDTDYVRIPAVWDARMDLLARAYYTAQALGMGEELHPELFAAYHQQRNRMRNEREIAEVFVANGVDRDTFSKNFNSFGVISQSMQAKAKTLGYRITGTPAMIVNGKYRISGESAGSNDAMLDVAEYLVEKERQAASK